MSICWLSIASINTFSKVCSSFQNMGPDKDPRHKILPNVDGVELPVL